MYTSSLHVPAKLQNNLTAHSTSLLRGQRAAQRLVTGPTAILQLACRHSNNGMNSLRTNTAGDFCLILIIRSLLQTCPPADSISVNTSSSSSPVRPKSSNHPCLFFLSNAISNQSTSAVSSFENIPTIIPFPLFPLLQPQSKSAFLAWTTLTASEKMSPIHPAHCPLFYSILFLNT